MTKSPATHTFTLTQDYAIARANLSYFCPSIVPRAEEIYRSIQKQKTRKDTLQVKDLHLDYILRGRDYLTKYLGKGPFIFTTFHTGPVGPLLSYLSTLEMDFKLLVNADGFAENTQRCNIVHQAFIKSTGHPHSFEMLNAEDKQIGLQMTKALRNNCSLVVYVDGNTGIGGMDRRDKKLTTTKFMGKTIFTRRGISLFSLKFNSPILPVISYVESHEKNPNTVLEFFEPILPDLYTPPGKFVTSTNQNLYSILEKFASKFPEQWEGWAYFDSFIDKAKLQTTKISVQSNDEIRALGFNTAGYSFLLEKGEYYLLNHANYKYTNISEKQYIALATLKKTKRLLTGAERALLSDFVKTGVLI